MDDINKMFDEANAKKFAEKYEALCKETGLTLRPTMKLGFDIVKLEKE